jgi:hypothetical protein
MLAQKMVSSVSSLYLCDLCGIVTQFPKTAAAVFLKGIRDYKFVKRTRLTIPRRKRREKR